MKDETIQINTKLMDKFLCLDSFRGMAILWIVYFHVLCDYREGYGKVLNLIIHNGHLGVEIFFVISGFGISTSVNKIINNNGSVTTFIKKRLSRIYIVYFFSLIFAALFIPTISPFVSMLKGYPLSFDFFRYSFVEWIELITLSKVFSSTSWHLNLAFCPINGSVWFISIIVQIYVVVAFAMIFKSHYYKIILFISFLSSLTLIPALKSLIPFGLFLPYWLEFSVGILLYYMINSGYVISVDLTNPNKNKIYLLSFILYFVFSSVLLYFLFSKILFSIIIGVLFWLIYPIDNILIKTKLFRLFLFLGMFSYSLYVLHVPLTPFVDMFVRNLIPIPSSVAHPFVLTPSLIALSFLWYLFFEKPGSVSGSMVAMLNPFKTIQTVSFKK